MCKVISPLKMRYQDKVHIWPRRTTLCSLTVIKIAIGFLFIGTVLYGILCILHDITTVTGYKPTLKIETMTKSVENDGTSRMTQENLELARIIKRNFILPSFESYNLKNPYPVAPHVLERAVRQITNLTTRGIFVEVGAGDGEYHSPTICLEIEDNWYGLLIEANTDLSKTIDDKNRKVYISPTCVGFYNYSYEAYLTKEGRKSRLQADRGYDVKHVNCYPLYSHLLAFGTTSIDFLVININGDEAKVLQTLYWDNVNIKIIATASINEEKKNEVEKVLKPLGYKLYKTYIEKGERYDLFLKLSVAKNSKYQDKTTFYFIS